MTTTTQTTQTPHQKLSDQLATYPRRADDAPAGSEVGILNAKLTVAQAAVRTADERRARLRDRMFGLERQLAAVDEHADFVLVAAMKAEVETLRQVIGTLELDRSCALTAQSASHARNTAWVRAATTRERIMVALQRVHDDEPTHRWYRQGGGAALFDTLDRLIGTPAQPAAIAA